MERLDELLAGYLDETLESAEVAELADRIEGDGECRKRFLDLVGVDGLLRAEFVPPEMEEELVRRTAICLVDEEQERRTASAVMRRIAGDRPRRPRFRRLRIPSRSAGPVLWALAAACAAVFITLVVMSAPTGPRRPKQETIVVAPPPAPPAPVQKTVIRVPESPKPPVLPKSRPVPAPASKPAPAAPSAPPRVPAPSPRPPKAPAAPPAATIASIATVVEVSGRVLLGDRPARQGTAIEQGDSLTTAGDEARVVLTFGTGTRIGVSGDAAIDRISLRNDGGRDLTLRKGSLTAQVARQPAGKPFIVRTPRAEVRVLGTRLAVTADEASTRLEVATGRVRLIRGRDGRSIEVRAGHVAVAAEGVRFVARRIPSELFSDSFELSPIDQWPRGWSRHASEPGTRSGFRILADPAVPQNRLLGCPTGGGPTQHAFLPATAWPDPVRFRFRLRLTGTRISRAGIQIESGSLSPSIEYDAGKSVVRIDWPRNTSLAQANVKVPVDRWTDWLVERRGERIDVALEGRTVLSATVPGFGPVTAVSLVSRGADSAWFDDVRVERSR